jgi:uncharacterized protein (TIGR03435 family)
MKRLPVAAACAAFACISIFGQSADNLTFDVGVVKAVAAGQHTIRRHGGPGTDDPGRMNWEAWALYDLLTTAYSVKPYQLIGPDWLRIERYDITATLPPDSTKEQANIMLQNLLKERFGITLHHHLKEFEAYNLTVAKDGPKLKKTDFDPTAPAPASDISTGPDRLPHLAAPGIAGFMREAPGGGVLAYFLARAQTMAKVADWLSVRLSRPVIDETILTGEYDFSIAFAPDDDVTGGAGAQAGIPSDPGSNLAAAVQSQLGLKLTKAKAKLDVIMIDQAERTPKEN